jgi:hypothetical protein
MLLCKSAWQPPVHPNRYCCRFLLVLIGVFLSAGHSVCGQEDSVEGVIVPGTRAFLEHPEVFFESPQQQSLCLAIFRGDLQRVKEECRESGIVNAKGKYGVTPLFWAYLSRRMSVYKYLLEQKADPNIATNIPYSLTPNEPSFSFSEGDSVIYMAANNKLSEEWLRIALRNSKPRQWVHSRSGGDLLHAFFRSRGGGTRQTAETLTQLITFGVDLDQQANDGQTALAYAVSENLYALATQLLEAGASPACYDNSDYQVIHLLAISYRARQNTFRESPIAKSRWDASQEKKDWDKLVGLLRDKGFRLTDALLDLERAADPQSGLGYMYKRRLARQDRFCCGTGRKLQETLGDSVEELPPQQ